MGQGPAFLFDLDGTLVDSVYQHVLAWQEALDRMGIELAVWTHPPQDRDERRPVRERAAPRDRASGDARGGGSAPRPPRARRIRAGPDQVRPLPGARELLDVPDATRACPGRSPPAADSRAPGRRSRRSACPRRRPDRHPRPGRARQARPRPVPRRGRAARASTSATRSSSATASGTCSPPGGRGALGVGLLSGGYGQEELERAGAYRVYEDPPTSCVTSTRSASGLIPDRSFASGAPAAFSRGRRSATG